MLIIGIKDDAIREKLLGMDNLTLDKAIECCFVTETSRQQLKVMKEKKQGTIEENVTEIDAVGIKKPHPNAQRKRSQHTENNARSDNTKPQCKQSMQQWIKNCNKCGRNHLLNAYAAYGKICNKCSKSNHFANVCRNKKRKINIINCNDEDSTEFLSVDSIRSNQSNYCTVDLVILLIIK